MRQVRHHNDSERTSDQGYCNMGDNDLYRRHRGGRRADQNDMGPPRDIRIRKDCCDQLADSNVIPASTLIGSVSDSDVTLEGRVATRQQHRSTEDCVKQSAGVTHVQNNLHVGETPSVAMGDRDATARARSGGKTRATDI